MSTPSPGRYVLKASCASRLGTMARISGFLAQRRCYIDVKHALVLGMIRDCALDQVGSADNAAGTERASPCSTSAQRDIEALVRHVEKIETAVEPRFQRLFVEAIAIPHLTAPDTQLRQLIDLPPRAAAVQTRAERGRRSAVRRGAAQALIHEPSARRRGLLSVG